MKERLMLLVLLGACSPVETKPKPPEIISRVVTLDTLGNYISGDTTVPPRGVPIKNQVHVDKKTTVVITDYIIQPDTLNIKP